MPLPIKTFAIPPEEVEFSAIRAQGAGGQNVNKVSCAIHLRFDIAASSLPEDAKAMLVACKDQRINKDGVVVIKAQQYRSQEQNKMAALERLYDLIESATTVRPLRRATKPTRASQRRRVDSKVKRGEVKVQRGKIIE